MPHQLHDISLTNMTAGWFYISAGTRTNHYVEIETERLTQRIGYQRVTRTRVWRYAEPICRPNGTLQSSTLYEARPWYNNCRNCQAILNRRAYRTRRRRRNA